MPNSMAHTMPMGSSHGLNSQKKVQSGSPKAANHFKQSQKSNTTVSGIRTGDVVSDDSDGGEDNEGHDHDSDDETDGFALSDARSPGNTTAECLTGLGTEDIDMVDDGQAVASAMQEDGTDSDDDDDDDDDYGAVNEISDGEDSVADAKERNYLRSAEEDLIEEFERTEKPRNAQMVINDMNGMILGGDTALARRLSLQSEDSLPDDFNVDLDFSQDPFGGLATNDELYQELVEDAEDAFDNDMLGSWRQPDADPAHENSVPSMSTQKKVRFEESPVSRSSSMSSDEDPREVFPDLFDGQDSAQSRQQRIFRSLDPVAILYEDSGYDYTFEDEDEQVAFEIDAESDSNSEMSDDDSDDGDTTDEESPDEQLARVRAIQAARAKLSPVDTPKSAPSTPVATGRSNTALANARPKYRRPATPKGAGRPRMGTFEKDPTRACVTADIMGSGIKMVCPTDPPAKDRQYWARAREAMGSRDGSPGGSVSWTFPTPQAPSIPKPPFTAKSTLGTMFDGNLNFLRNNDESGIAKDLLLSSRHGSMQSSLTSSTLQEDETQGFEDRVNLEDFVDMGESASETDEPMSSSIISPTQEFFCDSFLETSPMTPRDAGIGLLDHFDQQRGLVSSFRNNQHHARHVSSLPAHPAQRAQASEANALQKGRRSAANTPITPARKKRASQDFALTGAGVRKTASPLVQKRRRSRGGSLSQTLSLDRFAGQMS